MKRNTFIREENVKRVFDYLDSDASGAITVENLIAIMGSKEHEKEVIAEADLTRDGVISYAEFKALMTSTSGAFTPRAMAATSGGGADAGDDDGDAAAAPAAADGKKKVGFA